MAMVYFPDRIVEAIILNSSQKPKVYLRELAEKDIKEKGWMK